MKGLDWEGENGLLFVWGGKSLVFFRDELSSQSVPKSAASEILFLE